MSVSLLALCAVVRCDVIAVDGAGAAGGLQEAGGEVGGGGEVDVGAVAAVVEEGGGVLGGVRMEASLRQLRALHADRQLPGEGV